MFAPGKVSSREDGVKEGKICRRRQKLPPRSGKDFPPPNRPPLERRLSPGFPNSGTPLAFAAPVREERQI